MYGVRCAEDGGLFGLVFLDLTGGQLFFNCIGGLIGCGRWIDCCDKAGVLRRFKCRWCC